LWRFYRISLESFPEVYQVLAGTALMPHPGHCPGDEKHRKVAGLTRFWPRILRAVTGLFEGIYRPSKG